ncbi:MAG: ATP-binding protein [Thermoanaerobaculia bacterium]|jgi:signal transduction histidine kinase
MPRGSDDSPRCVRSSRLRASGPFIAALLIAGSVEAATVSPRNVLVLHYNSGVLPANVELDRGLRATIESAPDRPVSIFDEFLDMPRFGGEAFDRTLATFLRDKYAAHPPHVIVVGADDGLAFLLRNREETFPGVPIVHVGVSLRFLRSVSMPPDIVGTAATYDFGGTIEQALRFHPNARRLVLVTGTSQFDRDWERRLRSEVSRFEGRVTPEFLAGLSTRDLLRRLGELGEDSVVVTVGYFQDGNGAQSVPRDTVREMAAASTAPIYSVMSPQIGTGIVGGRMTTFEEMGRHTGATVNAILSGVDPASLHLPESVSSSLHLDWRQLRRWGIDEKSVPADSVVHFRTPSFFEQYRREAFATLLLVLLQAGLIAVLMTERRRRITAELTRDTQYTELAHASRLAVAGELTASIAHEINQPLGAILSNADAAELILESADDRRGALQQILADIRRDDLRASDVIRRLRTLLSRHVVEKRKLDVNDAVRDADSLLRSEARRRKVAIETRLLADEVAILGDPVQIQQVLINLILNAMDAVAGLNEERRVVIVSLSHDDGRASISVKDRGVGISPELQPRLFDSFYTTRKSGMGLGLSISRSIVEAHGGSIRVESRPGEGATFVVELPAAERGEPR